MGKRRQNELRDQRQLIRYIREVWPGTITLPGLAVVGVPRWVVAILKLVGYLDGQSDLIIYRRVGEFTALALELKHGYNKATEEQVGFLQDCAEQGAFSVVAVGFDAAQWAVRYYLRGEFERIDEHPKVERVGERVPA